MHRKIFETKYRDAAAATDYLNRVGWKYEGRRGWLRKYHRYSGVEIGLRGQVTEQLRAHLYEDGHVVLYTDASISGTLSTTAMPFHVWASKNIYDGTQQALSDINCQLRDKYGQEFSVELRLDKECRKKFYVYRLEKINPDQLGKSLVKPEVNSWESLREAFEWAAAESLRICAIKRG